jgi:PAS domain S-box-containing protein
MTSNKTKSQLGERGKKPDRVESGSGSGLVEAGPPDRMQSDFRLIASEARYRRLFETAKDGILILDANTGRIADVNPFLESMLGYTHFELIGKELWEIGPVKDISASQEAMRSLQHKEYIRYEDLPLRAKDGRLVQVEFVSNVYMVGEEKVIQCNVRDITRRKEAENSVRRQLRHLNALSAIDQYISANFDIKLTLAEILSHVTEELEVTAADILCLNSNTQMLESGAEYGFKTAAMRRVKWHLGDSTPGLAVLKRQMVQIHNLQKEPENSLMTTLFKEENFVCYYGVPIITKGQVMGVLEIYHRTVLDPDAEWFAFLNALAGQAAIAIENAALFENLQRSNLELILAYDATIEGWSRALDLHDKETNGHTQRVTEMTLKLAHTFNMKDGDMEQIRWGALLHDLGMLGVSDDILFKPGRLTDEEWAQVRKHPTFAYEMLSPIRYLKLALDIPYCHHEKWDGTGYPRGLKGTQIPLVARIFAVVDVWDSLNSDRPFRAAWAKEKVREYLLSASGTQFDPQVMNVFMSSIVL